MQLIFLNRIGIIHCFSCLGPVFRIFTVCAIVAACNMVSACGERDPIDGQQLVMKAVGDFRSFNEKVSNIEDADIDLNYLDNKFQGAKICQDNGYSISPAFNNLIDKTEIVYLNDQYEPHHHTKKIIIITDKYSFVFFNSDKWKNIVPKKNAFNGINNCFYSYEYILKYKNGNISGPAEFYEKWSA